MAHTLTRRQALAALAGAAALPMPGRRSSHASRVAAAIDPEADARAALDAAAERLLRLFPETATTLGLDTGERVGLRGRLGDRSAAGQERVASEVRETLAKVRAIDVAALSHQTRTSVEVVRSAYATAAAGFALPYGDIAVGGWRNTPYVVIQNVGAYLDLPRFLDADHPIDNAADAEAYLLRLRAYAVQLDGELGRLRAARAQRLVPPAFLIDKALQQMRLSVQNARNGASLADPLLRRAKVVPGRWGERARTIAQKQVAPALERQLRELEAQRRLATDDAGMWARPHGEEFYRWALRASTTTDMTPDEIHQRGRSELEELHAEMDAILRRLGHATGSVGERMKRLAQEPRYQFSEGDEGRAEIMEFIQGRLEWIRSRLPLAFNTLVNPKMEVKRLPPEEEPGAPTAYGGAGSIDGRIPGRYWINLKTPALHSKYSLADLTFHEAIPGHIWQGEYTHDMPRIRQLLAFNAYSEGWALYAQQLADELGAYADDPVGRLGYLQAIAFRACRLVVDTGIHAKQWTREQAVRFFVDVNGSNPEEVASEVDRYCSWPGQACGYKVGHTEINRLRNMARAALGTRFDVKAFNDTVVLGGNVPLDVLARNVGEYLESASVEGSFEAPR